MLIYSVNLIGEKSKFRSVRTNHFDHPNIPGNVFSITPSLQYSSAPEIIFQSPIWGHLKAWSSLQAVGPMGPEAGAGFFTAYQILQLAKNFQDSPLFLSFA
jgi:hypothetical protein